MSLLPNSDQQRIGLILTGGGARVIKFDRIQHNIDIGLLDALSITASAYSSGESVSFYQAVKNIENWQGPHRIGVRTEPGTQCSRYGALP